MSDAVLVAIIASLPGVLSVVVAGRANHNAKKARYQVENDHTTNLRVESDDRHRDNARALANITRLLARGMQVLAGMREDINYLRGLGHSNRSRIATLEGTRPRPEEKETES